MGGKALGFEAARLPKHEYEMFTEKLVFDLWEKNNFIHVDVVPAYATKPDFGDVDVVICCMRHEWEKFKESFKNHEFVSFNGDVFSVGYQLEPGRVAQVDYIYTSDEATEHQIALDYYSFNDCGNLVGKLAHFAGFKYGHKGLSYEIYNPFKETQKLHEIYLGSRFPTMEIHRMLGLDFDKFEKGFETLEEMFDWVAASPFFHPDLYLFENVNAAARIRDRKRKTYNTFLEWCKNKKFNEFSWHEYKKEVRNFFLLQMMEIDTFRIQYQNANLRCASHELIGVVFNGNVVSQLTGLTHKDLGDFMKYLKECGYLNYATNYVYNPNMVKEIVAKEFKNFSERKKQ